MTEAEWAVIRLLGLVGLLTLGVMTAGAVGGVLVLGLRGDTVHRESLSILGNVASAGMGALAAWVARDMLMRATRGSAGAAGGEER